MTKCKALTGSAVKGLMPYQNEMKHVFRQGKMRMTQQPTE